MTRDVFDTLLGRLERIESLIHNRVISECDFEGYFSYWLAIMGERPNENPDLSQFVEQKRRTLWKYIRSYQFNGVVRRYGRTLPDSPAAAWLPFPIP
ncbi:MAG TPA: hypothetical protein VF601_00830 [Beijerinckiaceae bacterium]|jgi:hypothetical protein